MSLEKLVNVPALELAPRAPQRPQRDMIHLGAPEEHQQRCASRYWSTRVGVHARQPTHFNSCSNRPSVRA